MRFKPDGFVLAIMLVVALAYWFPQGGAGSAAEVLDTIGNIGVALIFFFYGLKLGPDKVRSGLKNVRLHLLVQSSTFLLFPLIVLLSYPLARSGDSHTYWLGFLFLAALPSTVSSSVVMVSMAKGNVPAAIFNASISGLIGIFVTPLWMGLFLQKQDGDYSLSSIYFSLATQIILPVIAGIILQRYWGVFAQRYSRQLALFDKSVILLIIYQSFAASFLTHVFSSLHIITLCLLSACVIALFFLVYYLNTWFSRLLHFNREDTITATFCGTKKSLVHGTVFASILFPATFPTGIILLPLMLFHAFQLFVISIIAARRQTEV